MGHAVLAANGRLDISGTLTLGGELPAGWPLATAGGPGIVGQLAVIAGTALLGLALLALGAFAWKSIRGDGIEWPDEHEQDGEDAGPEGVDRGSEDDEWEFY